MNSGPQSPPDELSGDPSYLRLKEYVIEATGLSYYSDKDADLSRRLCRRLSHLGFQNCSSYLEVLRDPGRGPSEMDALIEEITIGETYFFRHREHFDALRNLVLPDLITGKAENRHLRIWCAGCADGAEPYSLSIVLRRELAPLLAGWEVSIVGTDINRQCLAAAREGQFDQWSLRSTPDSLRSACFEKKGALRGAEKGKTWTIAPEYKAGVSFQFHNLVEDAFPPQLNNSVGFDLIVCRNVMIYFETSLMRKIVQRFHECLAPGGWLLVGPSEPNMSCFTSFRSVNAPGVTLYQRAGWPAPESAAPFSFAGPPPPEAGPPVAWTPVVGPSERAIPTLADLSCIGGPRRAARGDWENAARCGRKLPERDNLNAKAHFHYALVLEQMGNYAESERSLRKAIYLDRRAVLPHYHLGLLLRSDGDSRQAQRCFNNALDLLATLSGAEILDDADGITAADLEKLARMQIENLRAPA